MSILNICGFETGDSSESSTTAGTFSIQSTTVRTGSYALRVNPTTTGTGTYKISGLGTDGATSVFNVSNAYYRFYFLYLTKPASNEEIFARVSDTTGGLLKISLNLTSTGIIKAYNAVGTLMATGTTVLSSGTWYCIQLFCGTGASGSWEVRINQNSELSGTGNVNTNNHGGILLGKAVNTNGQSVDFYYDDVIISDSGFIGPGQSTILVPNANGTSQDFSIGAGAGQHWQQVNDIPNDGDTTYLLSTGNNIHAETLHLTNITGNIRALSIIGIKAFVIVKRATASNGLFALAVRKYGGTIQLPNGANSTSTASYTLIAAVSDKDFVNNIPIKISDINMYEVGCQEQAAGSNTTRITLCGLIVDYVYGGPLQVPGYLNGLGTGGNFFLDKLGS